MAYYRPETLDDALAIRATTGAQPLAGGTDIYPARAQARGWGHVADGPVLDLSRLAALRGIEDRGDHWRIGALVTWAELCRTPLPPAFDGLKAAASEVGGWQVQNRGTIVGNLCNASPAADGVPALLCHDAEVVLAGSGTERRLPLAEFIAGNRRTLCRSDEIVTELRLPKLTPGTRSAFSKLGSRRYLVISIVMAAGIAKVEDGVVRDLRLAVGACSPVALRLPLLEAEVTGRPAVPVAVTPSHLVDISPIDDVRASAEYRRAAAAVVVSRLLTALLEEGR